MNRLWTYLKDCIFGNKLRLVDELIEIIETEKVEETQEIVQPKPRKPRKKKTDVSDN